MKLSNHYCLVSSNAHPMTNRDWWYGLGGIAVYTPDRVQRHQHLGIVAREHLSDITAVE